MTDLELKKAIEKYKMQVEGQRMLLESVANKAVSVFANQYFSNVNEENITAIPKDEILRNAFLSTFRETQESSNLLVYINHIQRINARIDDGQPNLMSINWANEEEWKQNGMCLFTFYCDLETNKPFLVGEDNLKSFLKQAYIIRLLDYFPTTESYHYNSKSLEKITKGSATASFNRLQLYYFKQLLETSREGAVSRIKKLTHEEMSTICNSK